MVFKEFNTEKLVAIDFEFQSSKGHYNVVCCSLAFYNDSDLRKKCYWLRTPEGRRKFNNDILWFNNNGYTFVAHAVEKAEAYCFCELGLDPGKFKWADTYINEVQIANTNINDSLQKFDLVSCLSDRDIAYLDSEHKKEIRAMIIFGDDDEWELNKEAIMEYCNSDVEYLIPLVKSQLLDYNNIVKDARQLYTNARWCLDEHPFTYWGHCAALYAVISFKGIPVNGDKLRVLEEGSADVAEKLKMEFNEKFPMYRIDNHPKKGTYDVVKDVKMARKCLEDELRLLGMLDEWPRSEKTGELSMDDKSMKVMKGNPNAPFCNAYMSHSKELTLFKGLEEKKPYTREMFLADKKQDKRWTDTFDGSYTHPSYGIITGTQTGRTAAKPSEGSIPQWSRVSRSLMEPKEGKVLGFLDYSSQETALMADWTGDSKMSSDYMAGDFYSIAGMSMGMTDHILKKEIKEDKELRDALKVVVLGAQYGRGAKALQSSLKEGFNAKEILDNYFGTYHVMHDKMDELKQEIQGLLPSQKLTLIMPDGFIYTAYSDMNYEVSSVLSSANFPIQGAGSVIIRRIVNRCYDEGIDIFATIHDEAAFICNEGDEEKVAEMLTHIMKESYCDIVGTYSIKVGEVELSRHGHPLEHEKGAIAKLDEILSWCKESIDNKNKKVNKNPLTNRRSQAHALKGVGKTRR